MFKLFKSKTELEKLYEKHKNLLSEAHKLSTVNRTLSDEKVAAAEKILEQITALEIDNKS